MTHYRRHWDATYLRNQERAERMAEAHAGLLADKLIAVIGKDEYENWCDTLPDEFSWQQFCEWAQAHLEKLEAHHEAKDDHLRDDAVIRHPARSTCSEYQTVDRLLT